MSYAQGKRQREYSPFDGYNNSAQQDSQGNSNGEKLQPVDWEKVKLIPSKWVTFSQKSAPAKAKGDVAPKGEMSTADADLWRKEHNMTISGKDCPPPMTHFSQLEVPQHVHDAFERQGFPHPTPIQSQAWPVVMQNRDFVGIAKTGSGKTLAFMVPAVVHLAAQPPLRERDGPIVLVLAPTRELAQQIEQECVKILSDKHRITCIYGGVPKGPQIQKLQSGVQILVATPGRLIDFLTAHITNLLRVTYLVLDEADRMLDMGFEPQIRAIISQVREDRQTLMFSATWPTEIRDLAASFQRNFIRLHVGSEELYANADVQQLFHFASEREKMPELKKLMHKYGKGRVIIFTNMKRMADLVFNNLKAFGMNVLVIHGDRGQREREQTLERFRKDANVVLVATDVAARGLDVKGLDVVINYDMPPGAEDYVHRIGRTGRAGKTGVAHSFMNEELDGVRDDAVLAHDIIDLLEKAKQNVPDKLREWALKSVGRRAIREARNRKQQQGKDIPYKHSDRPSFDPSTGTGRIKFDSDSDEDESAASAPKAMFGVSSPPPAASKVPADRNDDGETVNKKRR